MRCKRLLLACLPWPLLTPASASALAVEIQGTRLEIQIVGASCVEIGGSYPGVTIEASQNGKIPRVCYNSDKVNSITVLDTTFIAANPVQKDVSLKFEHDFPAGVNGKVMARAKLQGFFSTADGVGIPSGDKASMTAFFSQAGHDDAIAEPFNLTVGDDMDSALLDYSAKEQYLIAGPRRLKGGLTLFFNQAGHKLTLTEKSGIVLDTGSTLADKLELMGQEPGAEPADEMEESAAPAPEGQKPGGPTKPAVPAKPAAKPPVAQEGAGQGMPAELPPDTLPFTAPAPDAGGNPPPRP